MDITPQPIMIVLEFLVSWVDYIWRHSVRWFNNSCFCLVLVSSSCSCAAGGPYWTDNSLIQLWGSEMSTSEYPMTLAVGCSVDDDMGYHLILADGLLWNVF